jgi:ABC-type transport system involved in multi-copper enzyme maturation permease subunit
VIRVISRKEIAQYWLTITILCTVVSIAAATMPFWYTFVLSSASHARGNDVTLAALRNLRSYPIFIEDQWCGQGLASLLFILALIGGAPAIAGERESKTLPLLLSSGASMRFLALVKFGVVASWLVLVALVSSGVITAHSLVKNLSFPPGDVVVASFVSLANGIAFLAIVFFATAYAKKTWQAVIISIVAGLVMAAALIPLGIDGSAMANNLFAVDGTLVVHKLLLDLAACLGIIVVALGAMLAILPRRPIA